MELKVALQFLLLHLCFYLAYTLECQKCGDSTNSACQKGTASTTFTCPPDEDSCYEENIVSGTIPPYRRGCAPWNWCAMQAKSHSDALKYCRTCQRDKCNNQAFGSSPSKECQKCADSTNSTCQKGTAETSFTCPSHEDSCYEENIVSGSVNSPYRRGCAPWNWCATQEKNHGDALKYCRTCRGDKCNNQAMKTTTPLNCIGCSGSLDSTCQMGTSQTPYPCPPDQPACYEEYIQYAGQEPLFRRFCGLADRCVTSAHRTVHGEALKYCRTCKENSCNNKNIAVNRNECMKCTGSSLSDCQTGEEEATEICQPGSDECSEFAIVTKRDAVYKRKCAPSNICDVQRDIYDNDLKFCRTCKGKKCNNQHMDTAEDLILNYLGEQADKYLT